MSHSWSLKLIPVISVPGGGGNGGRFPSKLGFPGIGVAVIDYQLLNYWIAKGNWKSVTMNWIGKGMIIAGIWGVVVQLGFWDSSVDTDSLTVSDLE